MDTNELRERQILEAFLRKKGQLLAGCGYPVLYMEGKKNNWMILQHNLSGGKKKVKENKKTQHFQDLGFFLENRIIRFLKENKSEFKD